MIALEQLSPIGIGTYQIDRVERACALRGLRCALEHGENFLSTGTSYGPDVMETVSCLMRSIERERIFLCVYIEPSVQSGEEVRAAVEAYLRRFGTDYVDCCQIHNPYETALSLDTVYEELARLREEGKIRFLGASNLAPSALEPLAQQWDLRLFEGLYNFECRNYELEGVTAACRNRGIRFVCYQPLRRNRTAQKNYPLLTELAQQYGCTQNQVILNWLIRWKGLQVIVKALSLDNIAANLAALDLQLEAEDYRRLDAFRCPECDGIAVDWNRSGVGIPIHLLANQF